MTDADARVTLTPDEALAMLSPAATIYTYRAEPPILVGAARYREDVVAAVRAAESREPSGPVMRERGYGLAIRDENGLMFIETRSNGS